MQLGVLLPSFAATADRALAAAVEADGAGLHGAFAYCHLWPLGRPGRPALSPYPLLGAVAARTSRIALGTLVARVGLESDGALIGEILELAALTQGRFIAGLGTGDSLSAAENLAFGVPFARAWERRLQLRRIAGALVEEGVTTWIGGGSPRTNGIARELGIPVNLWGASVEEVAQAAAEGPVTWGGTLVKGVQAAGTQLAELREAGAEWAVVAWPGSVSAAVAAANAVGIALQD